MKTAPTGTPIVAKHKPGAEMPHGWVAVILLGHRDDEEAGCLDTILHYNGNAIYRSFHGCWEGWLPMEALAARPASPEAQGACIKVDVQTMQTSAGADYYVRFTCGDRSVTPYMFKERYKAEYEAAHFAWVFGLRDDEPGLMAYDETSHPNDPAPPSSGQEG